MIKKILKYISTFIILLLIFNLLLFVGSLYPSKIIEKNVKKSSQILTEEGNLYEFFEWSDVVNNNYTDALMINEAYSIDNTNPLYSYMAVRKNFNKEITKKHLADTQEELISINSEDYDPVGELEQFVNGNIDTSINYARYWHGYLSILRTLLIFFDIAGIRKILLIIFIILVIIAIGMSVSDKMITNEKYQDSNVSFEIQKSWAKTTSNYSTEWNFYKYINNKPNTNLNSVDSNNEVSEDDYSSYPAGINIYYDTVAEDSGINNIEDIKTKVQQNIQSMEDKAENKADAVNMSITTTSNGYDLLKVRVLYSEKPQEILYYYYILNGDKLACITTYSFNLDDEKTIEEDTNNLVNSFKWF